MAKSLNFVLGECMFPGCHEAGCLNRGWQLENITKIPDYLISHCQKITEINIPATVTEIGTCAYRGTSIKQVTLPAAANVKKGWAERN